MINYILEVYELDSTNGQYTRIGELITYLNLEWNQKSNKPSTLSFSMNALSPEGRFIQPFRNWILLKRDGIPYLFQIVNVRGGLQEDTGNIKVDCSDVLYALNQLYVEGSYKQTNTDASTIAGNLVTVAQAKSFANYGIQTGTLETIGNTNETLFYQSIGKAIINQADNIAGYDFEFRPVLDSNQELDYVQFNVYKSSGQFRSELPPLELGYSVNVINFGMADEVYNKIYTLGADTGDVEVTESSDEGSKEFFGLREKVNKEPSVFIRNTLQNKGDSFLLKTQGVRLELQFKLTEGIAPYYGQFALMDTLRANIKVGDTFFNFQGTVQIREIQFRYNTQDNQETISPIIQYYKS